MLIQDFLRRCAAERPDKIALVCGGQRITYGQLEAMANRLAHGLRQQGVRRGDRVAIYLNNSVEAVVGIFAALKADAVFVIVSRTSKPEKVVSILNNCQAVAVLLDARAIAQGVGEKLLSGVPSLQGIVVCGQKNPAADNGHARSKDLASILATGSAEPPRCENIDLDLACLIYTSGTTGESKGVMCDHSNVVFVTESNVAYLENNERDIVLNVLPLASSYGLYQLMASVCVGSTLVLEESFAFPDVILERMAQERCTGFAAVPTIYAMLLGMDLSRYDLSALRYLTNAGAGLPVEHVKRLRQAFPQVPLFLMHGLTEVARTMYLPPDQTDLRPAASGIAIPGVELWVEDENGRRLGQGEIGELIVRGRNVMRGYWNAPDLTAKRFRPGPLPGERVCCSGDLFRIDEEGFFYFVSRKDDIIKSRGEKVAPREVENVLHTLPGVQEAAVIGVPDPLLGQAIKAILVAPGTKLTESEVISHCKARLEYFMVPREVEFRTELPKTGSGKIRKIDLR
ncbi:MAG TPA: AMP-binding protein [Candidatus Binatia bacterium]|jgi:long-chain acyl-CoA synthetase|nr:AMP-binding protein [Candidatus Binatia bacterium]